jgi:hypothetical protein
MALNKIIQIEGDAFINWPTGVEKLGTQKASFLAYCKIVKLNADKENALVFVECTDEKHSISKTFSIPVSVADDAPNFIKQAYLHLKTLPEWQDATDC